MQAKNLLIVLAYLLLLDCVHTQTCPEASFQILCSDTAPVDSWLSNVTGSILPSSLNDTSASVSITWQPSSDTSYRVITRKLDEPGPQPLAFNKNTRSFSGYTIEDLDLNSRYQLLVCNSSVTRPFLQASPEFILQCGYCQTCFNTGVILNVTSATVSAVATLSSEVLSEIYVCRAVGVPSPLAINWTAAETRGLANVRLTDAIEGVEISNYIENGETVSELKLSNNANLSSVHCGVVADGSDDDNIIVRRFQRVEPIITFINVTIATVMSIVVSTDVVVSETYICQAIGFPTPLSITWEAEDNVEGITRHIFDAKLGVEIVTLVENDTVTSELRLLTSAGRFHSPVCIIANGFSPTVRQQLFLELYYDIQNSTTTDGSVTTTSSSSITLYTLITLAVVTVVILIVIVVSIFLYRHFKIKRKRELSSPRVSFPFNEVNERRRSSVSAATLLKDKLPTEMFISPSDINVSVVIGQGEFGVIYKAYMEPRYKVRETVAVKTLKGIFATSGDIEKATEEIIKMSRFNHPNVMTLIGVCMAPANEGEVSVGPSIVMPFMDKGSLLDYLRKEAGNLIATNEDEETPSLRKKLIQMCQQIVKGMEYLAMLKFVHRDLAARNCLMDSNGVIKVSDFGLTEDIYTRNYFRQSKNGAKLPLKWMALESIKFGMFTDKSDVWSYGVTCWEVFSGGAIPYPGLHPQAILDSLEEGVRLRRPNNAACCSEMYALLQTCWVEQDQRPTFTDINNTLNSFLERSSDYIILSGLRIDTCDGTEQDLSDEEVTLG